MPSDNGHMDYVRLLEAKDVHNMEQVQGGIKDAATMLFIHYEELKKAGFKKSQAYEMTLQFHVCWIESIFSRMES